MSDDDITPAQLAVFIVFTLASLGLVIYGVMRFT